MNHISRGAPAKYAHFPNIEKIGHSERVSCGTCAFYDRSDRSCKKQPVFVPEIGYNYWKYCKHFQLFLLSNLYCFFGVISPILSSTLTL